MIIRYPYVRARVFGSFCSSPSDQYELFWIIFLSLELSPVSLIDYLLLCRHLMKD